MSGQARSSLVTTRECACGECRFREDDGTPCPKLRDMSREEFLRVKGRRMLWAHEYDLAAFR